MKQGKPSRSALLCRAALLAALFALTSCSFLQNEFLALDRAAPMPVAAGSGVDAGG